MKNALIVFFVLAYICLSAFLETGEGGGRLVYADLILVGLCIFSVFWSIARHPLVMSSVHMSALPMLFVFLATMPFALYPDRVAVEFIAILVGFMGSWAIANLLIRIPEIWFRRFLKGYVFIIGAIAFVSLLDFLVLPGLISSKKLGGLQGPFRNTGQAGSFFGLHGAVCLALILGGCLPRRPLYFLLVSLVVLALFATLKRAAGIGFIAGLIALLIQMLLSHSVREKRNAVYLLVCGAVLSLIGIYGFNWALENVEFLKWKFEYKISEDAVNNFREGFFAQNLQSATLAFLDSPVIGVGLDNVREVYQKYEIHSTYLAIFAYGGFLGVVTYSVFLFSFLKYVWTTSSRDSTNHYLKSVYYLAPMIVGLLISFGYTYHLRKREFWILVFIIIALRHFGLARQAVVSRLRSSSILTSSGLRNGGMRLA